MPCLIPVIISLVNNTSTDVEFWSIPIQANSFIHRYWEFIKMDIYSEVVNIYGINYLISAPCVWITAAVVSRFLVSFLDIQQLMGCFLFQERGIENSPYAHLISITAWDSLTEQFSKVSWNSVWYPRWGKYKRDDSLAFSRPKKLSMDNIKVQLKFLILTHFKIGKKS